MFLVADAGGRWPHQAAAAHNRACAAAKTCLSGQVEAMAILIRQTLTVTGAPKFQELQPDGSGSGVLKFRPLKGNAAHRRHQHIGERGEP